MSMTTISEMAARQRDLYAIEQTWNTSSCDDLRDEECDAVQFEKYGLVQKLADTRARTLGELWAKAEVLQREFLPEDGNSNSIDALAKSVVADVMRLCWREKANAVERDGEAVGH